MGLHENDEMKPRKQDADREAIDYEQFLQDLEQDPELRQGANLYRDEQAKKAAADSEMDTDDDEDLSMRWRRWACAMINESNVCRLLCRVDRH
jgi:hypothetical protein